MIRLLVLLHVLERGFLQDQEPSSRIPGYAHHIQYNNGINLCLAMPLLLQTPAGHD